MATLFVITVGALTSVGSIWLGISRLGRDGRSLGATLLRTLDCVWAIVLFAALNASVGIALMAGLRAAGWGFVSSYLLAESTLPLISTIQGVFFTLWARRGPPG